MGKYRLPLFPIPLCRYPIFFGHVRAQSSRGLIPGHICNVWSMYICNVWSMHLYVHVYRPCFFVHVDGCCFTAILLIPFLFLAHVDGIPAFSHPTIMDERVKACGGWSLIWLWCLIISLRRPLSRPIKKFSSLSCPALSESRSSASQRSCIVAFRMIPVGRSNIAVRPIYFTSLSRLPRHLLPTH